MHESEAACLLRTGALYPRRVGLKASDGRMVFVGLKRGAFSLYFDDEPIYHFDLDGRWQRAYIAGDHFRKALNQTVDLIGREREPEGLILRRRARSRVEIDALDDAIRGVALDTLARLGRGEFEVLPPPAGSELLTADDLADLLERVASWDAAAWFARAEGFARVYGTEALKGHGLFAPPDSQNAIVLMPVLSSGEELTSDEFAAHCHAVAAFLGRRAIQSSSVFLGCAKALRRPIDRIASDLQAIAEVFPIREGSRPTRPRDLPHDRPSLSGIDAMLEAGEGGFPLPVRNGFQELAALRLRRITVSFGSRGVGGDLVAAVEGMKAAGLAISAVVPFGLGDINRMNAVVEAVNAMPLSPGDFIHLVDASDPIPGWEIAPNRGADDVPQDLAAIENQREVLTASLVQARSRGAKIVKYDPAKQWT